MLESLNEAREELKRVDHLIYVSLKYTRTVDVLLNIINRMIDAYDFLIEALLRYALEKNMIENVPSAPKERGELVKDLFEDELIRDNIELFFLLRKLHKSNPEKEQEYRRHVTMTSYIDNRKELVNIDIISQYYEFQKNFVDYVESLITGKNGEDN
ncbi:hypothetical protein HQ533_01665 [Candidatus Woesearchaeota archaeon]|nr:hypothetical protein [Candidatus Woesearchaeota archaeon]